MNLIFPVRGNMSGCSLHTSSHRVKSLYHLTDSLILPFASPEPNVELLHRLSKCLSS